MIQMTPSPKTLVECSADCDEGRSALVKSRLRRSLVLERFPQGSAAIALT